MNAGIPADWADTLSERLLHSSIWGGLVIVGVLILFRVSPAISPRLKVWIWRFVTVKLLLLFCWPESWRIPVTAGSGDSVVRWQAFTASSTQAPPKPGTPSDPTAAITNPTSAPHEPTASRTRYGQGFTTSEWLVSLWLAGVLLHLARTGIQLQETQRLRHSSQRTEDQEFILLLNDLAKRMKISPPPGLKVHPGVRSPQVLGIFRPEILVSPSFSRTLSPDELQMVLAHELAHVGSRDLVWAWLRRLTEALYFFHPLVWRAGHEAALDEEKACDTRALDVTGFSAGDYSRTLVRVTEEAMRLSEVEPSWVGAGMSRGASWMASRLEFLGRFSNGGNPRHQMRRRMAWSATGLAAVMILGAGWLHFFPLRDIVQLDPRHKVVGYRVSVGSNHLAIVQTETLNLFGLYQMERFSMIDPKRMNTTNGTQLPSMIAGAFRRIGLPPKLVLNTTSLGTSQSSESTAFLVTISSPDTNSHARYEATLIDESGDKSPLIRVHSWSQPGSSNGVIFWNIPGRIFAKPGEKLELSLGLEGQELARIRLRNFPQETTP